MGNIINLYLWLCLLRDNVEFLIIIKIFTLLVSTIVIEGPDIEIGNTNYSGKILVPLNFELNIRWRSENEVQGNFTVK